MDAEGEDVALTEDSNGTAASLATWEAAVEIEASFVNLASKKLEQIL